MTQLVEKYGYCSEGESFSIADANEAWIMEMIGKGPDYKGAAWVAVRIPDDCVSGHANQARIRQFPLDDPENCLYAADVISFARQQGYFNGTNKDFSFAEAYAPLDFSGLRACEARVWSFFRRVKSGMDSYLPYIKGQTNEAMPALYQTGPQTERTGFQVVYAGSLRRNRVRHEQRYRGRPFSCTLPLASDGIHGRLRQICQRTGHSHATNRIQLCLPDAQLATEPHRRHILVWCR